MWDNPWVFASSGFLAVTTLSLVIAGTRTAGPMSMTEIQNSWSILMILLADAELRTRRNPWSQAFPTDGNLHRNPRVIPHSKQSSAPQTISVVTRSNNRVGGF
jgi:divalent metal cation (Fe/Co/Zn/Cd) transporter